MLSRVFALWLITLILLPFSAPFSTCDLASFLGSDSKYDESSDAYAPLGSMTDTADSHALPVAKSVGRVKFPVLADAGLTTRGTERMHGWTLRDTSVVRTVSSPLAVPLRI